MLNKLGGNEMYALVTGATSGIGREYAKLLAKDGYNLIIVGRRKHRLEEIKEHFEESYNIKVVIYKCDLAEPMNVKEFLDFTKHYKDITVVVNSAGFGKMGFIHEIDETEQLKMITTNITALHMLTKHFACVMEHGDIINISSIAGVTPTPYMSQYGATKAYVYSLSLALNYEMKKLKKDVNILCACPGPVDTEFGEVAEASFKLKSISARRCAELIYKAQKKKKSKIMVDISVKLAYIGLRMLPHAATLPIEYKIQRKKTKDD